MDEIERKALALACECAGRKLHHYALMGDDLPLRWSIVAHADTIMHYEALQAERDAQAAEIARLRDALGFYANLPCRLEFGVVNECPYDDGDTARAALAQETQP